MCGEPVGIITQDSQGIIAGAYPGGITKEQMIRIERIIKNGTASIKVPVDEVSGMRCV